MNNSEIWTSDFLEALLSIDRMRATEISQHSGKNGMLSLSDSTTRAEMAQTLYNLMSK